MHPPDALRLPALIDSEVGDFLTAEGRSLFSLTRAFGSPLHLTFPAAVLKNINEYQRVFEGAALAGVVLYATKANKSESFLEATAAGNAGADVSSLQELRQALAHGIPGSRIGVSGGAKSAPLLLLACNHGCTIAVDSVGELHQLLAVASARRHISPPRVLVRLNDIGSEPSRFGVPRSELPALYDIFQQAQGRVVFGGYSFHLEGYSLEDRVRAIALSLGEIQRARLAGFAARTIDIGGGFPVSYVAKETWERFSSEATKPAFSSLFFRRKSFASFYPYYHETPRAAFLARLLNSDLPGYPGRVQEVLRAADIELVIEPGRSLLDQAGLTLMRVADVKSTASGELVVVVEANINHLSEQWFESEYLPEPLHLPLRPALTETPTIASVGGNTCMERDMLSWRRIAFEHRPEPGDLLIYLNTAGYQMDTNESEFHRMPIPEKFAAFRHDGRWNWTCDREFSALALARPA